MAQGENWYFYTFIVTSPWELTVKKQQWEGDLVKDLAQRPLSSLNLERTESQSLWFSSKEIVLNGLLVNFLFWIFCLREKFHSWKGNPIHLSLTTNTANSLEVQYCFKMTNSNLHKHLLNGAGGEKPRCQILLPLQISSSWQFLQT